MPAVEALHISAAAPIGRMPGFARCQRKPARHRAALGGRAGPGPVRAAKSGRKTHATAASMEADERRSIDRPAHVRTRDPSPAVVDGHPSAVVEGCKAPRCLVHPMPSPRRHPDPASGAVRRPASRHRVGVPDRTIGGVGTPGARGVERIGAGHFRRHIAPRLQTVLFAVALGRPVVERRARQCTQSNRPSAGQFERVLLTGRQHHAAAGDVDLGMALENLGLEHAPHRVDIDAVVPGRGQRDHCASGGDLPGRIGRGAQADADRTARHLDVGAAIVEPKQIRLAFGIQAQGRTADRDLGPGAGSGQECAARGDRQIELCRLPGLPRFVPGLDIASDDRQAPDAFGRIVDAFAWRLRVRHARERSGQHKAQGEQAMNDGARSHASQLRAAIAQRIGWKTFPL